MLRYVLVFILFFTVFSPPSWGVRVAWDGRINGYRTLFIDTEFGNEVLFAAVVPTGMLHDDPALAGISHHTEHQVLVSSASWDEGGRVMEQIKRLTGGGGNAQTHDATTSFYFHGHLDSVELMVKYLGAALSTYQPVAKSFWVETEAIRDELAKFLHDDDYITDELYRTEFLPPGHFLRKVSFGLPHEISRIGIDDSLNYYYANFRPEYVILTVIGNFSRMAPDIPPYLKRLISQNFTAPVDRRGGPAGTRVVPSPKIHFAPLIAKDAGEDFPRITEVGTDDEYRTLRLTFQLPEDAGGRYFDALEMLHDVVTLDLPGSFIHELQQLGWVIAVNDLRKAANNLKLNILSFSLTDEGFEHRYEIVTELFVLLGRLARDGISEKQWNVVLGKEIASYQIQMHSTLGLLEEVENHLWRFGSTPQSSFDYVGRYSAISAAEIAGIIPSAFSLDRMVVSYLGPEITSAETSGLLARPHRFEPSRPWHELWRKAYQGEVEAKLKVEPHLNGIEIPPTFGPLPGNNGKRAMAVQRDGGNVILVEEDHRTKRVGLSLRLQSRFLNQREQSAFVVFFAAFQEHIAPSVAVYDLKELFTKIEIDPQGEVRFLLEGERESVRSAAEWVAKEWPNFVPSKAELAAGRRNAPSLAGLPEEKFSSDYSDLLLGNLVSRFGVTVFERQQGTKEFKNVGDLMSVMSPLLERSDIRVSAVGDMTLNYAAGMVKAFRESLPRALTEEERAKRKNSYSLSVFRPVNAWHKSPRYLPKTAVGVSRLYNPVVALSSDGAALTVLEDILHEEIDSKNRESDGLGYAHGTHLRPYPNGNMHLLMSGQTLGGPSQAGRITEGWQSVIDEILKRGIEPLRFQEVVLGMTRRLDLIPPSLSLAAEERDLSLERFGRPDKREELLRIAGELTPDSVRTFAARQLGANPWVQVVVSDRSPTEPCPIQIVSFDEIRSHLHPELIPNK